MALLTAAANRWSKQARMTNVTEILPLFAELVLAELDFRLEALNMMHVALASEDADMKFVRVPRPIPGLVTAVRPGDGTGARRALHGREGRRSATRWTGAGCCAWPPAASWSTR